MVAQGNIKSLFYFPSKRIEEVPLSETVGQNPKSKERLVRRWRVGSQAIVAHTMCERLTSVRLSSRQWRALRRLGIPKNLNINPRPLRGPETFKKVLWIKTL